VFPFQRIRSEEEFEELDCDGSLGGDEFSLAGAFWGGGLEGMRYGLAGGGVRCREDQEGLGDGLHGCLGPWMDRDALTNKVET